MSRPDLKMDSRSLGRGGGVERELSPRVGWVLVVLLVLFRVPKIKHHLYRYS